MPKTWAVGTAEKQMDKNMENGMASGLIWCFLGIVVCWLKTWSTPMRPAGKAGWFVWCCVMSLLDRHRNSEYPEPPKDQHWNPE